MGLSCVRCYEHYEYTSKHLQDTGVCRVCEPEYESATDDSPEPEKTVLNQFSPLNKPSETKAEEFAGVLKTGPQPDTQYGHPEFHRIVEEMRALHAKKAADYGLGTDVLANCRGSVDFGIPAWIGVVMRMNDKMTRLKSFAQKGSLQNESVEDSLLDTACYAILALILYREQSQEGGSK